MGASGITTVNFGSFPGVTDASVAVTGQTGILAGSVIGAWLIAVATADHLADEHLVDGPVIVAGNISAGTGFTIYAVAPSYPPQPDQMSWHDGDLEQNGTLLFVRTAPLVYGLWTVAWCWN